MTSEVTSTEWSVFEQLAEDGVEGSNRQSSELAAR